VCGREREERERERGGVENETDNKRDVFQERER